MNANAARKSPAASTILAKVCSCGHIGRGPHRKACVRHIIRKPVVANDVSRVRVTVAPIVDVTMFAAPELPAVRQVTVGMPEMAPPCDARIVVDVIRAGWCSWVKTLSYGLCRAGIAPARIQSVIAAAMKSGLIECVRGVWAVSGLVA